MEEKRKMNYANGKIYKIVNDVNDMIYIGSTTQSLAKRWHCHKCDAKTRNQKSKIYVAMREIGVEAFRIILIENYACSSKEELLAREQHHIDLNKNNTYNCFRAYVGLSKEEYAKLLRKECLERNPEHYNENNAKWSKTAYLKNREKRLQEAKEYVSTHREHVLEYQKQYKIKNHIVLNEKKKAKIACECGATSCTSSFARHIKTKKHISFLTFSASMDNLNLIEL